MQHADSQDAEKALLKIIRKNNKRNNPVVVGVEKGVQAKQDELQQAMRVGGPLDLVPEPAQEITAPAVPPPPVISNQSIAQRMKKRRIRLNPKTKKSNTNLQNPSNESIDRYMRQNIRVLIEDMEELLGTEQELHGEESEALALLKKIADGIGELVAAQSQPEAPEHEMPKEHGEEEEEEEEGHEHEEYEPNPEEEAEHNQDRIGGPDIDKVRGAENAGF
jgi:hypothetical protein